MGKINILPTRILISFLCFAATTQAQTTQVWADYTLNFPFANAYLFSTELSYHTIISKENKWREAEINPIIQWSIDHHVDVMTSLRGSVTLQSEKFTTNEIRPAIGIRYHFTPHWRVQLRGLFQIEQRNLYHKESSTWNSSFRSRFRAEALIPINRKTIFEDKLWYGLLDAEFFWVMDKELEERYSNQMRFRIGVGYRTSYNWRFEIIYTDQFTRNNLDQEFQEVSNIFRFRVKHFINKAKPAKHDPNHN